MLELETKPPRTPGSPLPPAGVPIRWLRAGIGLWWAVAVWVGASGPAVADDWPQWLGPQRDGVWAEAGAVTSWPRAGLTVRWRFGVDRGFSSPVVAGGRVYVTDAVLREPQVKDRVHCLDAESGKLLWTRSWDADHPEWIFMESQRRGPGATPITHDGRLYVLGIFGELVCLDAASGDVRWQKNLRRRYHLKDMPTDPSPLIEGGRLIVFVGGSPEAGVLAFNPQTGDEIWRALDEALTHSSPIVIEAGAQRQLIVWTHDSVSSLDPATGRTLWAERMVTSADAAVATPVFANDYLLVGGLMMRFDGASPKIIWPETRTVTRRVLSNISAARLQGEHVYSGRNSGALVCLERSTGKEIWSTNGLTDQVSGAGIHLTAHGDMTYLFTNQGELILARLSPEGYRALGRGRLIQPTWPFAGRKVAWAAPAFADRHIYVRNDEEVICASLAEKR